LVECQLPKLNVEGSSPFARSFLKSSRADTYGYLPAAKLVDTRICYHSPYHTRSDVQIRASRSAVKPHSLGRIAPCPRKNANRRISCTSRPGKHASGSTAKNHYLGEYGTPESRDRYDELIDKWFRGGGEVEAVSLRIDDLCLLYLAHCEEYYQKHGKPTREVGNIKSILRRLVAFCGHLRVREFSPMRLEKFRNSLIGKIAKRPKGKAKTLSRQYINKAIEKTVRMFRWGVTKGHVPVKLWQELSIRDVLNEYSTC
jgi:hypothetical protein